MSVHVDIWNPFLVVDKQFGTNNVTVIVEWSEQDGVLDDLIVVPQVIQLYNGSTNAVLIIQYNVLYNVSVTLSHCGQISTSTLDIYHGEVIFNSVTSY